jgi:hypothetical protein
MESQKLAALQEALLAEGHTWGDVMFLSEKEIEKNMTNAQKKATANAANANALKLRMAANIEKKKAKFMSSRNGELKKIAKQCKWECQGEVCWAHSAKTCPYIHKNQKGSNKTHAVALKKNGGRRTRRNRRDSRR